MSYKIKSLIYFVAFVISAIILHTTDVKEETTLSQKSEIIDHAITNNSNAAINNEAELLGDVR